MLNAIPRKPRRHHRNFGEHERWMERKKAVNSSRIKQMIVNHGDETVTRIRFTEAELEVLRAASGQVHQS